MKKVISIAPTRISLMGGGTDVDPYASKYGGMCINLAINIRQHFILDTTDFTHSWLPEDSLDFLNKLIDPYKVGNLGIKHNFDGPIESGLGSSASAAVALIGAINKLQNLEMTRDQIAEKAWDIEVNKLGLFGGKQDQYAAAYGGFNLLQFSKHKVNVIGFSNSDTDKLYPSLVLFYLGQNRKSANIQEGFKKLSEDQIRALDHIKQLAAESIDYIHKGDIERLGYLLTKAWDYKKKSNKGVSNELIDKVYTEGIMKGALGGKVLGAGGGGHMLFLVEPKKKEKFINDMKVTGIKHVDFSIDNNGLETRVIE